MCASHLNSVTSITSVKHSLNITGARIICIFGIVFEIVRLPSAAHCSVWRWAEWSRHSCCPLWRSKFVCTGKKLLGVQKRDQMTETNRYPIFVNSAVRCVHYCLKITRMGGSRLPGKAYRMLRELDARGKRNWVSNVRCKLNQFGFGCIWPNHGIERINQKPAFSCSSRKINRLQMARMKLPCSE